VNYASDSVELKCEYIKEAQTDYTVEDLRLKATRLSALYQETSGDLEASHIQHSHLVERIRSEARKEIDRGLQKENFFLKMKSEKAKIVEGKRAAYQNILKIIQELESKAPKC
jgi:predicted transcriptional regulator